MPYPDPNTLFPLGIQRLCFLKNVITNPKIQVGDYTYYDDPDGCTEFETKNVLYHFPFSEDQLIIGRFCALATGVRFIMNGGNHRLSGFSTYPFDIFGADWGRLADIPYPDKGDTVVGHDVWMGYQAVILPGVRVGSGAVIGAQAVVTKDVQPYTIVGGNPAQVIHQRFPDAVIEALLQIAWWDWHPQKITANLEAIVLGDFARLEAAT